jgi:hypothetical protein
MHASDVRHRAHLNECLVLRGSVERAPGISRDGDYKKENFSEEKGVAQRLWGSLPRWRLKCLRETAKATRENRSCLLVGNGAMETRKAPPPRRLSKAISVNHSFWGIVPRQTPLSTPPGLDIRSCNDLTRFTSCPWSSCRPTNACFRRQASSTS